MSGFARVVALVAVLLTLISSLYPAEPALADGQITVLDNGHQSKFPDQIIFKLQVQGLSEIKRVTLYYKFKGNDANAYAYPQFTPGNAVTMQYSYDVRKSYVPPGTDVTYYWQITDAVGNETRTEPLTFTYEDNRFQWQSVAQGIISVHYYRDETLSRDLLVGAAEAVSRESRDLRVSYTRPMKVYVYASKADMQDALPKKSATYDSRTTTLGVRLSDEVLLLLGNQPGVMGTLYHEIMHMIVAEAAEGPYSTIPRWLDEGLAMWSEGPLGASHQGALNRAVRDNNLISVRSLTGYTGDAGQVNLFYAEADSVVRYLIDTHGLDKLADLLAVYKQGSTTDKALTKVYGFTTDELDARWRTHLGAVPSQQDNSQRRISQPEEVPTLVPFGSQIQGASQSRSPAAIAVGAGAVLVAGATGWLIYRRRRRVA